MRFYLPRFMISEHPFPWLLPLIAMLLVFAVFPLAYNIYLSFHVESAMIDGASQWTITTRFTIPMLSKVIAVIVLIRGIDLFRTFDYIFVMTYGGP